MRIVLNSNETRTGAARRNGRRCPVPYPFPYRPLLSPSPLPRCPLPPLPYRALAPTFGTGATARHGICMYGKGPPHFVALPYLRYFRNVVHSLL